MKHALLIRGLLDPTEEELIDTADETLIQTMQLLVYCIIDFYSLRREYNLPKAIFKQLFTLSNIFL